MPSTLRIPLPIDVHDELEDAFIDQKEDSHTFIWQQIRGLCRDAKMGKLNKACIFQKLNKAGGFDRDSVKLKEVTLEELPSNPDWVPLKMEADEVSYFEHKITEKTLKYLMLFSSFSLLRYDKLEESIKKLDEENLAEMRDKITETNRKVEEPKIIEAEKKIKEADEERQKDKPTCMEQCVFNSIYQQIYRHVVANVDKSFDKENEEMYPPKDAKKPETKK